MTPTPEKSSAERVLAASWRTLAGGAVAVGRGARSLYLAIDPDVRRHLAQTPLFAYRLIAPSSSSVLPGTDDGYRPLIFVHGLGGHHGDFLPMATYLRFVGRKRTYRIGFQTGQSLEDRAEALAAFVNQVRETTGHRKVDIVAHSLGGLIARMAVADQGLARAIKTLVTLGTPHAGTHTARYADTAIVRQLRPGSPLLNRLARKRWPKGVRVVSFFSEADVLIVPAASARFEPAENINASPQTHYGFLLSPTSWRAVHSALSQS